MTPATVTLNGVVYLVLARVDYDPVEFPQLCADQPTVAALLMVRRPKGKKQRHAALHKDGTVTW